MTTPHHPMQQFHDLLHTIRKTGVRRPNRTGQDTLFIPGAMMRFDMADGFPAITTKKLAFKTMIGELLGFFRGYDNAAQFRALGCKVWDGNANETPSWLANPARKGTDDIGRTYGSQWTDWSQWAEAFSEADEQRLGAEGYVLKVKDPTAVPDGIRPISVWRRGIHQLEEALRLILTDPTNRRIIVSGWRPDEHHLAAIPVCHTAYQWLVDPDNGLLHMTLWQRSFDTALAFNVSLGALFLEVMARLSGLKAASFTHFISDAHIYLDHLEGVETILSREHFAQPVLRIAERVRAVSVEEIAGVFTRIEPADFELVGYRHHDPVKMTMAA